MRVGVKKTKTQPVPTDKSLSVEIQTETTKGKRIMDEQTKDLKLEAEENALAALVAKALVDATISHSYTDLCDPWRDRWDEWKRHEATTRYRFGSY